MTLRESIYAALTAGSPPARVHTNLLPQNAIYPAYVYTIVYLEDQEDLGGNDNGLVNAHVQLDTYALTEIAADAVSKDGRDLMRSGSDFTARSLGAGYDSYEPDTRLYRVMREFSVWKNQ